MNKILQDIITHTEEQVKDKDAYQRIVLAGMKFMFDPKTHAMLMEGMDQAPDLAEWAGKGIVGIVVMLAKQSRGTMPFQPALSAGVTLLMHGLDALEQAGKIQVDSDFVGQAVKAYSMGILHVAGIDENKLAQMTEEANQTVQNRPDLMAKLGGK